jgi:hypothetical protein
VIDATKQIKSHHFGGQSPTERQRIANGFSGGQRSRTAENFWVLLEGWAKVTAHSPEGRQYGRGFCNFN